MNTENRYIYRLVMWANKLVHRYRKSWNGLSILVFAEDSARPPDSYRINYLILLFMACIIIILPLAALWGWIGIALNRETRGSAMANRIALLEEISQVNEDKTRLWEDVQTRAVAYRMISNQYQDIQALGTDRPGDALQLPRGSYNSMRQELNEMRLFRQRFLLLMKNNRNAMSFLEHRMLIYDVTPRGIPLRKEDLLWVGKFGNRLDPETNTRTEFHEGVDLICLRGKPIMATAPGKVIEVQHASDTGYGLFVRIHHGLGFTSLYAHNQENLVEEGDTVKRGQVIAKVGATGRTTGAHLHYEIKIGPNYEQQSPWRKRKPEDPTEYF